MKASLNKNIIYGVKTGETFHYIGKTSKKVNAKGDLKRSNLQTLYVNKSVRKVFDENAGTNIVPITTVNDDEWFDTKLSEVVKKYGEHNPLVNAQWMLDGKRGIFDGTQGYWIGKTRDSNTLLKLSESKFKKIVQYDVNGYKVKIWDSIKDVATKVFKDYRITNGSGCSSIYPLLGSSKLKTRFRHGSYWFTSDELIAKFTVVPLRLKIEFLTEQERLRSKSVRKKAVKDYQKISMIIHSDVSGKQITHYNNIFEASYYLDMSVGMIRRHCRNEIAKPMINLKYGEKLNQPVDREKYWKEFHK